MPISPWRWRHSRVAWPRLASRGWRSEPGSGSAAFSSMPMARPSWSRTLSASALVSRSSNGSGSRSAPISSIASWLDAAPGRAGGASHEGAATAGSWRRTAYHATVCVIGPTGIVTVLRPRQNSTMSSSALLPVPGLPVTTLRAPGLELDDPPLAGRVVEDDREKLHAQGATPSSAKTVLGWSVFASQRPDEGRAADELPQLAGRCLGIEMAGEGGAVAAENAGAKAEPDALAREWDHRGGAVGKARAQQRLLGVSTSRDACGCRAARPLVSGGGEPAAGRGRREATACASPPSRSPAPRRREGRRGARD